MNHLPHVTLVGDPALNLPLGERASERAKNKPQTNLLLIREGFLPGLFSPMSSVVRFPSTFPAGLMFSFSLCTGLPLLYPRRQCGSGRDSGCQQKDTITLLRSLQKCPSKKQKKNNRTAAKICVFVCMCELCLLALSHACSSSDMFACTM